ncbi:MAG: four-helix bundle copper-binding protein [Magnetococcales bacterium]|nr:four-helix bundle copper-binding protein [Magnetococcales bacterium]
MTPQNHDLNRRQVLVAGAVAALAATVAGEALAEGQQEHKHADHGRSNQAVVAAAMACIDTGQACLSHCLTQFKAGDVSLAACASSVVEMLPLISTLSQWAALDSKQLPKLAAICIDVCQACETECRKHAEKHASCRACAEACVDCIKACKALV